MSREAKCTRRLRQKHPRELLSALVPGLELRSTDATDLQCGRHTHLLSKAGGALAKEPSRNLPAFATGTVGGRRYLKAMGGGSHGGACERSSLESLLKTILLRLSAGVAAYNVGAKSCTGASHAVWSAEVFGPGSRAGNETSSADFFEGVMNHEATG